VAQAERQAASPVYTAAIPEVDIIRRAKEDEQKQRLAFQRQARVLNLKEDDQVRGAKGDTHRDKIAADTSERRIFRKARQG